MLKKYIFITLLHCIPLTMWPYGDDGCSPKYHDVELEQKNREYNCILSRIKHGSHILYDCNFRWSEHKPAKCIILAEYLKAVEKASAEIALHPLEQQELATINRMICSECERTCDTCDYFCSKEMQHKCINLRSRKTELELSLSNREKTMEEQNTQAFRQFPLFSNNADKERFKEDIEKFDNVMTEFLRRASDNSDQKRFIQAIRQAFVESQRIGVENARQKHQAAMKKLR